MTSSSGRGVRGIRRMLMVAGLGIAAGAGGLGLGGGVAAAQPDNRPPDSPPLGGPAVKDRKVPGVAGSFGDSPEGQKRRMADRIPPRVMREAMRVIMDDQAPEDLAATPEQRENIQAAMRGFESQMRDYIEQHRKELEELRGRIPEGAMNGPAGEIFRRLDGDQRGGDGGRRRPPPPPSGEPAQGAGKARKAAAEIPIDVRDRLREIAAGMPPFEQVYTKVWAELRPEQQKAVQERLDEFRDRLAQRRQDEYVDKRVKKDGPLPPPGRRRPAEGARIGGPDGPDGPQGGPPPRGGTGSAGAGIDPQRRDRLLRAFENMTPEQQDQVLSRLESRDGAPAKARPKGNRVPPKRGERRPPPDADHVPVPPPSPDAPPPNDGEMDGGRP